MNALQQSLYRLPRVEVCSLRRANRPIMNRSIHPYYHQTYPSSVEWRWSTSVEHRVMISLIARAVRYRAQTRCPRRVIASRTSSQRRRDSATAWGLVSLLYTATLRGLALIRVHTHTRLGKGKVKVKWIYIAPSRETSKALRHGSHSVACNYTDPCLYLV